MLTARRMAPIIQPVVQSRRRSRPTSKASGGSSVMAVVAVS